MSDHSLRQEAAATHRTPLSGEPRFEVLPFASALEQARLLDEPTRITVTASPRLGLDHTFDQAVLLRELGHRVTPHLAARMVRDHAHLDELLRRVDAAGIDDVFVIGGDATEPAGVFHSAGDVLDVLDDHALRPAHVGIGAYPETHPLIAPEALRAALARKSRQADYMVTQLCFDPAVLLAWIATIRAAGIALPVFPGIPGPVDRRRLLDISVRVGVGPSLSYLRKQRGLGTLMRSPAHAAERLHDALRDVVGDPRLGVAGWHFYTFNELVETWRWDRRRTSAPAARRRVVWRRRAGGA